MQITTYKCDMCGKEIVPGRDLLYKIPKYELEEDGRYYELHEPMDACLDCYNARGRRIVKVLASNGPEDAIIMGGQLMRAMSDYILTEMNERIPELMYEAIEEKAPEAHEKEVLFRFYGHSDDTAVAEWVDRYSDVGAYDRTAVGAITAPDGTRVRVVGRYISGAWAFGIMQMRDKPGEVQPLPKWLHPDSIYFETNRDPDYSVRMSVWAPQGSAFKWEGEE